jgi:hypothetical protein
LASHGFTSTSAQPAPSRFCIAVTAPSAIDV